MDYAGYLASSLPLSSILASLKGNEMKALKKSLPSVLAAMFFAAGAQAATIDFSEVPLLTTNPTIGGITFTAGTDDVPNSIYNAAITDDFITPGNAYLLNGYGDGTNGTPSGGESYIGISGMKFGVVQFLLDVINLLPANTIAVEAYLNNVLVNTDSLDMDGTYSLQLVNGFDELRLVDGMGGSFSIDDFTYREWVAPNPNPNPTPEPSVIGLLGLGLLGLAYARRRQAA